MRREGCTAAELDKAVETVANQLLATRPMSQDMRSVLSLFASGTDARDEAWLAEHGIDAGAESRRSPLDAAPAFADPENEELFGRVQLVWDEVIRSGEEPTTAGGYRVAMAMAARGEITEEDVEILLDFAVDEKYEPTPWGEWLNRARMRVDRERGPEAG